jgi:hypothetical protein
MSDPTLNPAAQAASLSSARPKHRWPIDEEFRQYQTDPTSFALVPISVGEEQRASARAEAKKVGIAYEVLKEALVMVDDKAVDWAGPDSREIVIERCSPKVRDLMLKAYHSLHVVPEEQSKAFLAKVQIII